MSVTYVVPTFNSARTVAITLASLRNQDVSIRVADSGSTDGTLEICRAAGVETLYVPPGNMYRAINEGLRTATTEWIAYVNSDDWLYAGSVERLLAHGADADLVYGDCDLVDGEGRFIHSRRAALPRDLLPLFRLGIMAFIQPATLYRRALYERLGGFDDRSFRFAADADFFVRAVESGCRLAYVGRPPVAAFRLHEGQLTVTRAQEMNAEIARITARLGGARLSDRLAYARWRMRNAPQYVLQSLRKR